MARPSNTKERRLQIVNGLQQAMAQNGYEKATVAAIARAANLSSGLVHYHFSSKQEILLELVDHLARRLTRRYQEMTRGEDSPAARLEAFIDAHLATGEGSDEEAMACWVTIGTEALRQPEVGEVYRKLMLRQRDTLMELLQPLCRPGQDTAAMAAALLAAIEGCYQLSAACGAEMAPPGFAARSVRAMACGLLAGRTELSRIEPS